MQAAREHIKDVTPGDWFNDPTCIKREGSTEKIYYSVRRYVPAEEVKSGAYVLAKGEYINDGLVRTKSGREKRITRKGHAYHEEVVNR